MKPCASFLARKASKGNLDFYSRPPCGARFARAPQGLEPWAEALVRPLRPHQASRPMAVGPDWGRRPQSQAHCTPKCTFFQKPRARQGSTKLIFSIKFVSKMTENQFSEPRARDFWNFSFSKKKWLLMRLASSSFRIIKWCDSSVLFSRILAKS